MKGETKKCKLCKTTKPIEEFHKSKKGTLGRKNECKQCVKAYMKKYNAEKKKGRQGPARLKKPEKEKREKKSAGRDAKKLAGKIKAASAGDPMLEAVRDLFATVDEMYRLYREILLELRLRLIERTQQLRKVKAKLVDQKEL